MTSTRSFHGEHSSGDFPLLAIRGVVELSPLAQIRPSAEVAPLPSFDHVSSGRLDRQQGLRPFDFNQQSLSSCLTLILFAPIATFAGATPQQWTQCAS